MATLTADQVYLLNRMCPTAQKAAIGDNILQLQSDVATALSATGVLAALAAAAASVNVHSQKVTALANGTAATDAVNLGQLNAVAGTGPAITKVSLRIDKTTDAALISGAAPGMKTVTKNFAAALPAQARVIATELILTEVVDNVTNNATVALKVGGTDDNGLVADVDVTTGGIGLGSHAGAGADAAVPFKSLSAQQLAAVLTATEDVNTMTKGDLTINVFYVILA